MAISKGDLISKLIGAFNFLVKWEEVSWAKREAQGEVENAEDALSAQKDSLMKNIIIPIIAVVAVIVLIIIVHGGSTGVLGLIILLAAIVAFIINVIQIPIRLFIRIPLCKKDIGVAVRKLNVVEDNIHTLCNEMSKEVNDTNEMFNGDYYPLARHVKFGIEGLQSGRADDFKEFMNLIDDLAHKEKLEAEARKQTALAQQAASDAAAARYAAEQAQRDYADAKRKLDSL